MPIAISRRRFLRTTGQATLAAWLGIETTLDALAQPDYGVEAPESTSRGILSVRLRATELDAMAEFYGRGLGWSVERRGQGLRVQSGGTELFFDPAEGEEAPYYHLAWAIPSNKFEIGKRWLAERVPLLTHPDGRDEFHFRTARRRAVYFADPAGNILELIARDDLGDRAAGDFGLDDLLYVNHAGLVVDSMDQAILKIRQALDLPLRARPSSTFTQLGDAHRHIVLVPRGRLWLPELDRGAQPFETELVLHGPEPKSFDFESLPYRLSLGA